MGPETLKRIKRAVGLEIELQRATRGNLSPFEEALAHFRETATQTPFAASPGRIIGFGWNTIVTTLEKNNSPVETQTLNGSCPTVLKFERFPRGNHALLTEARRYEEQMEEYLGKFMPPTLMVLGHGIENQPGRLTIQTQVKGKHLRETSPEEIKRNPGLILNLLEFCDGVLEMAEKEGKIPDLTGRLGRLDFLSFVFPFSRNLIVNPESGQVALVDTTAREGEESLIRGSILARLRTKTRLTTLKIFREWLLLQVRNREMVENEKGGYLQHLQTIVRELEGSGLPYRIVGGYAVDAILSRETHPRRKNGTIRDVDVIILSKEHDQIIALKRKLDCLQGRSKIFPPVNINWLNRQEYRSTKRPLWKKILYPARPIRLTEYGVDDHGIYDRYGDVRHYWPDQTTLAYEYSIDGICFKSFHPEIVHWLYFTRRGGLDPADQEKVAQLGCYLSSKQGDWLWKSFAGFVTQLRKQHPVQVAWTMFWTRLNHLSREKIFGENSFGNVSKSRLKTRLLEIIG